MRAAADARGLSAGPVDDIFHMLAPEDDPMIGAHGMGRLRAGTSFWLFALKRISGRRSAA
jgi:hypothetical protein